VKIPSQIYHIAVGSFLWSILSVF